jgi:hypothetical protein
LIRAQKVIDADAGDALKLESKTILVNDGRTVTKTLTNGTTTGNVITQVIKEYTDGWDDPGDAGYAAFNLKYLPFNLDLPDGVKAPVWIIRNGVNDAVQDGKTDFTADWWDTNNDNNGNGAVGFKVPVVDDGMVEIIADGRWGETDGTITFTIKGYSGTAGEATMYYAGVTQDSNGKTVAPAYYLYKKLGSFTIGPEEREYTNTAITITSGPIDVYLLLVKDGKMSNPPYKIQHGVIMYPVWEPNEQDLKKKFGKSRVEETFRALHDFIQMDGLTDMPEVIKLGDYIDLASLTVDAYNGGGAITPKPATTCG